MSNNDDLCALGVVTSRCQWCCEEARCNYDRWQYSCKFLNTGTQLFNSLKNILTI